MIEPMNTTEQIKQIDRNIEAAKEVLELTSALDRLLTNRDFRKVITEGYLTKEAVRLVQIKGQPAMQTPEKQAAIMRDIDSIGSLHQYFNTLFQQGGIAAKQITDDEEMRLELTAEEE
jgi:hypothetical protein